MGFPVRILGGRGGIDRRTKRTGTAPSVAGCGMRNGHILAGKLPVYTALTGMVGIALAGITLANNQWR